MLESEIDMLSYYLQKIDNPKDKIEILVKLMPYIFPRIRSTTLEELNDNSKGESFLDIF